MNFGYLREPWEAGRNMDSRVELVVWLVDRVET